MQQVCIFKFLHSGGGETSECSNVGAHRWSAITLNAGVCFFNSCIQGKRHNPSAFLWPRIQGLKKRLNADIVVLHALHSGVLVLRCRQQSVKFLIVGRCFFEELVRFANLEQ